MRAYLVASLLVTNFVAAAVAQSTPAEVLFQEIEQRYKADNLPKALRAPITPEQADAFAAGVKYFREASKQDLPKIEAADTGDDRRLRQDKQRLANWVGREAPRQIDEALQQTRAGLEGAVGSGRDFVKFAADIDMQDQDKVRNNFANPDNVALREEAIRDTLVALNLLIRIDEQLGEKSEWPTRKTEFEGYAAKFHEKLAASAAMIVPPKDIGDAELRGIAETTLKDPQYGAKEWKRLIVNSAKQGKQYSVYEVRENTITRVDYDYDYFQATTIEPEGTDLFLFHNTLAFYRSGATTTVTGKWVVRERFRGARIVAENVDK